MTQYKTTENEKSEWEQKDRPENGKWEKLEETEKSNWKISKVGGGWWCRKAWKDQSKKETRRNEGNELEKQAISMKEKEQEPRWVLKAG